MIIPVLHTPRLILRAFGADDVDEYACILADPDVTRFLGDGAPLGADAAWRQLAMLIGHWELRGFGMWAVEERASGRIIGRIGCFEPEGWPGFELGYVLAREAWGHGYAREGATVALRHAQVELAQPRVISLIRPENVASIKVATSLGAHLVERTVLLGGPSDVYEYPGRP
ncbi:MAG: GNAT family N-acetyltransferase [Gemmatimonadaceae bacterium]